MSIAQNRKSAKPAKPAICTFVFDVIVTGFNIPSANITELDKLSIDVTFESQALTLTASRINVSDFASGRQLEVQNEADRLRSNLEACGLPVTVTYKKRALGSGQMIIPEGELENIKENMSDFKYNGTCEIALKGEPVGTVDLMCSLVIKCMEPEGGETRRGLEQNLYPQDILFVVGESQRCPNPCDPCDDVWDSDKDDEVLNLDLSRYRNPNSRVKDPPGASNPCGTAACCELKKMAIECNDLINSITKSLPTPPERNTNQLSGMGGAKSSGGFNVFGSFPANIPSDPSEFGDQQYGQNTSALPVVCMPHNACGDIEKDRITGGSVTPLTEMNIKPIRFCPVCLKNMSWMPKFATCPNCGVRPMPGGADPFAPKKLTADQIMQEYVGQSTKNINDDFCKDPCKTDPCCDEEQTTCRCTCKHGKLCTHCRVRNLCADIFKFPDKTTVECPKVEPNSSEDFCVVNTSSKECRPYLARVFSELRDLYDIKKNRSSELDAECNKQFSDKKSSNVNMFQPKEKQILKNKKYSFDKNQLKKEYNGGKPFKKSRRTLSGHKDCVKRQKRVPHAMGWLWTADAEAKSNGWRPGAVKKSIKKIMNFFLDFSPAKTAPNICTDNDDGKENLELQKPILNVSKKNHEIFIELRPLRNPAATKGCAGGHENTKPITFKITKSPVGLAMSRLKRLLKRQGFEKCTCHQPVYLCTCRDFMEKLDITQILNKECSKAGMTSLVDKLVLDDTSESEIEFDFDVTPPAALTKLPTPSKPTTASHGTQFDKKDLKVEPKWPKKLDPYWRGYDCAVGSRYTGVAFGSPGEQIFEDGAFGMLGGGPHGIATGPGAKLRQIYGSKMRGGSKGTPAGFAKFPGGKAALAKIEGTQPKGKSGPFPVRQLKRTEKELAEKQAKEQQAADKKNEKRGFDMMTYLAKSGTFKQQDANKVGPDGLTDAQRKRRKLMESPPLPICMIQRLRKGYDPCECYNYPCAAPCNSCYYDMCGNLIDPRWVC